MGKKKNNAKETTEKIIPKFRKLFLEIILGKLIEFVLLTIIMGTINNLWIYNNLVVNSINLEYVEDSNFVTDDGKINVKPLYYKDRLVTDKNSVKWNYKVTIDGNGVISNAFIFYSNAFVNNTLVPQKLELNKTNPIIALISRRFHTVPKQIDDVEIGLFFTNEEINENAGKNTYLCLQDKESRKYIIYLVKIKPDKTVVTKNINEILTSMQFQKIDSNDYKNSSILSLENIKIKEELKLVSEYLAVLNQ